MEKSNNLFSSNIQHNLHVFYAFLRRSGFKKRSAWDEVLHEAFVGNWSVSFSLTPRTLMKCSQSQHQELKNGSMVVRGLTRLLVNEDGLQRRTWVASQGMTPRCNEARQSIWGLVRGLCCCMLRDNNKMAQSNNKLKKIIMRKIVFGQWILIFVLNNNENYIGLCTHTSEV